MRRSRLTVWALFALAAIGPHLPPPAPPLEAARDHPVHVLLEVQAARAAEGALPARSADRLRAPFTFGIPIPDHARLADTRRLLLAGSPVAQYRVVSRWPSGHIRWLLVDGLVDVVGGRPNRQLMLTAGEANTSERRLTTTGPGRVEVDTGRARFTIPAGGAAHVEAEAAATPEEPATAGRIVVLARGQEADVTAAVVVEDGPLRARVRLEGTGYSLWLDFHADRSGVRVVTSTPGLELGCGPGEPVPLRPAAEYVVEPGAGPAVEPSASRLGGRLVARSRDPVWYGDADVLWEPSLGESWWRFYHMREKIPVGDAVADPEPPADGDRIKLALYDFLRGPAEAAASAFGEAEQRLVDALAEPSPADLVRLGRCLAGLQLFSRLTGSPAAEAAWRRAGEQVVGLAAPDDLEGLAVALRALTDLFREADDPRFRAAAFRCAAGLQWDHEWRARLAGTGLSDAARLLRAVSHLLRHGRPGEPDADRLRGFALGLARHLAEERWWEADGGTEGDFLISSDDDPAQRPRVAAADGALLEAFRLTGDPAHLDKAKKLLRRAARLEGRVVAPLGSYVRHPALHFVQSSGALSVWRDLPIEAVRDPLGAWRLSWTVPPGAEALWLRFAAAGTPFAEAEDLPGEPAPAADGATQTLLVDGAGDAVFSARYLDVPPSARRPRTPGPATARISLGRQAAAGEAVAAGESDAADGDGLRAGWRAWAALAAAGLLLVYAFIRRRRSRRRA